MTARDFHNQVIEEIKNYTFEKVEHYFTKLKDGDGRDHSYAMEATGVYNGNPCLFYPYLACATRLSKSIDAVELGADRGIGALFLQSEVPGKVFSVDIEPRSWGHVPGNNQKIIKIVGSSIKPETLRNYDLSKARFWFIDSEHNDDQFAKEIELYKNRWEKGTIVFCDDIRLLYRSWQKLPYDKYEDLEGMIHGYGVGLFIV